MDLVLGKPVDLTSSPPLARTQGGSFAYQPVLDGWRAVSIILVAISHGGLGHLVPGGLGVTIFFFISGFLITSLLLSEYEKDQQISLKNFYLRRFWRLSPPLMAYIVLSTLLILFSIKQFNILEPLSAILYFANYYSIHWHYESVPFGPSPLKILWSLAIEEHFYIFFAPLMAFFAYTRNRLFALLVILLAAPLLIRVGMLVRDPETALELGYIYMATETRIDSIAWGTLLAWLCSHVGTDKLKSFLDNKIAVGLSLALMLLCLLVRDERFRESLRYSLQGLALISLFYVTLNGETLRGLRSVLASRLAVLIGKLSYSIYLYHWLALVLANGLAGQDKLTPQWLAYYYLLTVGLSLASYRYIEQPSLALRKRYGSHASA